MCGSRVVPRFAAIGRSLEALRAASGVDDRVRRMVSLERRQPTTASSSFLVAAAYLRPAPGSLPARTTRDGEALGPRRRPRRSRARRRMQAIGDERLWQGRARENARPSGTASALARAVATSVIVEAGFLVPLDAVPPRYPIETLAQWLRRPRTPDLARRRLAKPNRQSQPRAVARGPQVRGRPHRT